LVFRKFYLRRRIIRLGSHRFKERDIIGIVDTDGQPDAVSGPIA
jgi:hypothetical protein